MKEGTPVESEYEGIIRVAEYKQFIRFMALPRVFRTKEFGFGLLKDFAEKYDLSLDTLTDWQKKKGFWKAVGKEVRKWTKDKTPNVLLALYNKIVRDGNAAESKLWLQYVEDWAEKHGVELGLDEEIEEIRFHVIRNKDDIRHRGNKDI